MHYDLNRFCRYGEAPIYEVNVSSIARLARNPVIYVTGLCIILQPFKIANASKRFNSIKMIDAAFL